MHDWANDPGIKSMYLHTQEHTYIDICKFHYFSEIVTTGFYEQTSRKHSKIQIFNLALVIKLYAIIQKTPTKCF